MRGLFSTFSTCLLATVLLLVVAFPSHAFSGWTLVKHEGRDYVTVENVGQFYQLGNVQNVGNNFALQTQLRSLRGQNGSKEIYINNLKFILSYPIAEHKGKLIVSRMDLTKLIEPILRPGRITSSAKINTVILDPGHGGHDRGATCLLGHEANYTLDVALRARKMLQAAGFNVIMTRTTDVFIPLEDRARLASKHHNAIFISIHFNSSSNRLATGVETYTLAPRGVPSMGADGPKASDMVPYPGNARDTENIALACASHAALVNGTKLYDRGIKRARFHVIRNNTTPGVLIEGGFLSNASDSRRIATTAFRQQMATSIVQAARNYRNAVGSGGTTIRPSLPVVSNDSRSGAKPTVITPSGSTR